MPPLDVVRKILDSARPLLVAAATGVFAIAIFASHERTVPPTPAETGASPSVSPAPSPSATALSIALAQVTAAPPSETPGRLTPATTKTLGEAADDAGALATAAAKLLALSLAATLLLALVWGYVRRPDGVLLEDILDGTGEKPVQDALAGLTEVMRDRLRTGIELRRESSTDDQPKSPPSLVDGDAESISRILTTFKDVLPTPVSAALLLVQQLMAPASDIRVTAKLVAFGETPGRWGVTIRIRPAVSGSLAMPLFWEPISSLSVDKDKRQRARDLLEMAMDWVAIELWRERSLRELHALLPWSTRWARSVYWFIRGRPRRPGPTAPFDSTGRMAEAAIHNDAGYAFKHASRTYGRARFDRAIQLFDAASVALSDWYLPIENKADSLSMRGVEIGDPEDQRLAIRSYGDALERLEADGAIRPTSKKFTKAELEVAQAMAKWIVALTAEERTYAEKVVGKVIGQFGIGDMDDELLYTIACSYAIRCRRHPSPALLDRVTRFVRTALLGRDENGALRHEAARFVCAALLRRRDQYGDWLVDDPDLVGPEASRAIQPQEVKDLVSAIDRALKKDPRLATVKDPTFATAIDEIVAKAGSAWSGV